MLRVLRPRAPARLPVVAGSFGPTVAVLFVIAHADRRAGLRAWIGRSLRWPVGWARGTCRCSSSPAQRRLTFRWYQTCSASWPCRSSSRGWSIEPQAVSRRHLCCTQASISGRPSSRLCHPMTGIGPTSFWTRAVGLPLYYAAQFSFVAMFFELATQATRTVARSSVRTLLLSGSEGCPGLGERDDHAASNECEGHRE